MNYTYDNIGQLTAAKGTESGGVTNRLLEQLGYVYDAAHNLNFRTNNALVQTFGVNNLNELSAITKTGTLTVEGTSSSQATNVTVNGSAANLYGDYTFALGGFTPVNGNNTYTAIAKDSIGRQDTNVITAFLPASPTYVYDLNGNLTSDGTRTFDYDDENQLIRVTVTNAWKSEFTYDGKLRRRIRKEFTWNSAWIQTNEVHYLYDANVVIQERDLNNLPVTTYTRGNDLSGSLQGAGGIGGLLALTQPSTVNPQHYFYHADGNGNITALINAQQIIIAKYLYDPFGAVLSSSGPLAPINRYQFSSKESDQNSGLIYFLFRYYDSNLQRWLNRDPIGERGGYNVYDFVLNNPMSYADLFGHGGLVPGAGGATHSQKCNCEKNGGKWTSIAQQTYGGDLDKCINAMLNSTFPGNLGPGGNILTGVLITVGGIVSGPVGAVGKGLGIGRFAQLVEATSACTQMFCSGASNPNPPPPGPIILPQIPCSTCVINIPPSLD